MEIKNVLEKPYTERQHDDFIVANRGFEIRETADELQSWGYTEEEKKNQRQSEFERSFLETSLGNYRLQPKGYANAQQSIDTVNAMVTALGGLNEQLCYNGYIL